MKGSPADSGDPLASKPTRSDTRFVSDRVGFLLRPAAPAAAGRDDGIVKPQETATHQISKATTERAAIGASSTSIGRPPYRRGHFGRRPSHARALTPAAGEDHLPRHQHH